MPSLEPDFDAIHRLVEAARRRGDAVLVGPDAMAVAAAIGVACPASLAVPSVPAIAALDLTPLGDRVVIKAVSPGLVHKSDAGAIAIVENDRARVAAELDDMAQRLRMFAPSFLVSAFVPHDHAFGGELIAGAQWTAEFGPVVSLGPGGTATEFLARTLQRDRSVAILSPSLIARQPLDTTLRACAAVEMATTTFRGREAAMSIDAVAEVMQRLAAAAARFAEFGIADFEINPLVASEGALVALDARLTLGTPPAAPRTRPVQKLRHLLTPARIAIAGVSADLNPGRIIVRNLLREGFDPERITIIKPGVDRVDGCRCVPTLAAMPQEADLLVLSVPAAAAASFVVEAIRNKAAESIIVIAGGLEETSGGKAIADEMLHAIDRSRRTPWQGPVVNGGNCIGVRSKPGRYDTTFIPADRLPLEDGPVAPAAVIAQSGALALTLLNKLVRVNPRYVVTVGNQIDLTVGDYLAYLKDDRDVEVFGVYVEGFKPLDGAAFMSAAAEIVASGRTVVLYRGGRTPAGVRATSSHTASLAGDYAVTRALARQAGVLVAETLDDFEDLVKLFAMLRGRRVDGWRLGALSNAGFECVALADNLGRFELARFSAPTTERLHGIVKLAHAERLVEVRNPLDVTPMIADLEYDEIVRAVLADPHVDAAVVGCVPMTPALNTMPLRPTSAHAAAFGADSIVTRLAQLTETTKPWIAVVDAGAIYEPMIARLEAAGIPTFRTADRALRLFEIFCGERQRHEHSVDGAIRAAHVRHAEVRGS
jgi:acyl-CoA synthetase (NDP forming)